VWVSRRASDERLTREKDCLMIQGRPPPTRCREERVLRIDLKNELAPSNLPSSTGFWGKFKMTRYVSLTAYSGTSSAERCISHRGCPPSASPPPPPLIYYLGCFGDIACLLFELSPYSDLTQSVALSLLLFFLLQLPPPSPLHPSFYPAVNYCPSLT
jgi:hypothetical protein